MMQEWIQLSPLFGASFVFLYLFWVIFVGTLARWELLLGIVASFLGALGICVVQHAEDAHFCPRLKQWLSAWRLPWYLLNGTWEILLVSARDFLSIRPADSLFLLARFDAGEVCDKHDTGRRVLAVTYTTMAPNFIVIGVNMRDGFMLYHQIEKSGVPKLTQELGART
jgi:hypothetical protein